MSTIAQKNPFRDTVPDLLMNNWFQQHGFHLFSVFDNLSTAKIV